MSTELQKAITMHKRGKLERDFMFLWKALGGPELVQQHRFCERRWLFDAAYPKFKLAFEIEGGSWVNGAHTRGKHFQEDCEKYFHAAMLGWMVVRLTGAMIDRAHLEPLIWKLRSLENREPFVHCVPPASKKHRLTLQ